MKQKPKTPALTLTLNWSGTLPKTIKKELSALAKKFGGFLTKPRTYTFKIPKA